MKAEPGLPISEMVKEQHSSVSAAGTVSEPEAVQYKPKGANRHLQGLDLAQLRKRSAEIAKQLNRWRDYLSYLAETEGQESPAYLRAFDFWDTVRREYELNEDRIAALVAA